MGTFQQLVQGLFKSHLFCPFYPLYDLTQNVLSCSCGTQKSISVLPQEKCKKIRNQNLKKMVAVPKQMVVVDEAYTVGYSFEILQMFQ